MLRGNVQALTFQVRVLPGFLLVPKPCHPRGAGIPQEGPWGELWALGMLLCGVFPALSPSHPFLLKGGLILLPPIQASPRPFLKGTGSEGELGWDWHFAGLVGLFVCLLRMVFLWFSSGSSPELQGVFLGNQRTFML